MIGPRAWALRGRAIPKQQRSPHPVHDRNRPTTPSNRQSQDAACRRCHQMQTPFQIVPLVRRTPSLAHRRRSRAAPARRGNGASRPSSGTARCSARAHRERASRLSRITGVMPSCFNASRIAHPRAPRHQMASRHREPAPRSPPAVAPARRVPVPSRARGKLTRFVATGSRASGPPSADERRLRTARRCWSCQSPRLRSPHARVARYALHHRAGSRRPP